MCVLQCTSCTPCTFVELTAILYFVHANGRRKVVVANNVTRFRIDDAYLFIVQFECISVRCSLRMYEEKKKKN